jgi:hypothetical protein
MDRKDAQNEEDDAWESLGDVIARLLARLDRQRSRKAA